MSTLSMGRGKVPILTRSDTHIAFLLITFTCVNFIFTHIASKDNQEQIQCHQVRDENNEDYGMYEAGTTRTTDNNSLYGGD